MDFLVVQRHYYLCRWQVLFLIYAFMLFFHVLSFCFHANGVWYKDPQFFFFFFYIIISLSWSRDPKIKTLAVLKELAFCLGSGCWERKKTKIICNTGWHQKWGHWFTTDNAFDDFRNWKNIYLERKKKLFVPKLCKFMLQFYEEKDLCVPKKDTGFNRKDYLKRRPFSFKIVKYGVQLRQIIKRNIYMYSWKCASKRNSGKLNKGFILQATIRTVF